MKEKRSSPHSSHKTPPPDGCPGESAARGQCKSRPGSKDSDGDTPLRPEHLRLSAARALAHVGPDPAEGPRGALLPRGLAAGPGARGVQQRALHSICSRETPPCHWEDSVLGLRPRGRPCVPGGVRAPSTGGDGELERRRSTGFRSQIVTPHRSPSFPWVQTLDQSSGLGLTGCQPVALPATRVPISGR